ncbi:MAG: TonB-dependent receptor plug domain-containing protein [Deltaproteobacteria bacterium]|nr:TonB-dependent receptor plug domain-containing protein [Deltaproteobacteria bacterium]
MISTQEIKQSGARDLIYIFRMVPGFDICYGTSGTAGIGIRGNWATEGKALILVDGMDWNTEEFTYREFKSQTFVNFALLQENLMVTGLDLSLSIHNILNTNAELIEPYSTGYEPWHPGPGREFMAQLTYSNF